MIRGQLTYAGKLIKRPSPMVIKKRPPLKSSRYLPVFSMIHPAHAENRASGIASASIHVPDLRGEAASTVWKYSGTKYATELKTRASQKHTASVERFDKRENIRNGMIGSGERWNCEVKNKANVITLKSSRHTTVAELHGYTKPPNCRPSRSMTVAPATVTEPSQSIARIPLRNGVLGVWMSRNRKRTKAAMPSVGTSRTVSTSIASTPQDLQLIQKHHLQPNFSVNTPPKTGPRAEAKAHTAPTIPK